MLRVAVDAVEGRVPLFAGCGGSIGAARDLAAEAKRSGVSGLLVLPPYLVAAPQQGLVAYVRALADAAPDVPLIAYSRSNAVFDEAGLRGLLAIPQVIGLKDGVGDLPALKRMTEIAAEAGGSGGRGFTFMNGLPTAEVSMLAYRGLGIALYSSAVFAFAPDISLAFYTALTASDEARVNALLGSFFDPLVALRDEVPGYAVSLIKSAVTMSGIDAGSVRPPLVDPSEAHRSRLERIITDGRAVLAHWADTDDRVASGTGIQ